MEQNQDTNKDWFVDQEKPSEIGSLYEDKSVKDHKYFVRIKSQHLLKKAKELYGDISKIVCVDVGCGTGETIEYFQDSFKYTIGCDYVFGMLHHALAKSMRNTCFINSLSEQLPFKENSVDIVALYGVLHHIDSQGKLTQTLNEINRVLKPKSIVAIYEFNPLNPGSRIIVNTCEIDKAVTLDGYKKSIFPTTFFHWELKTIIKQSNFEILTQEYLLIFPKILSFLRPVEKLLSKIPIGAMSATFGRKSIYL